MRVAVVVGLLVPLLVCTIMCTSGRDLCAHTEVLPTPCGASACIRPQETCCSFGLFGPDADAPACSSEGGTACNQATLGPSQPSWRECVDSTNCLVGYVCCAHSNKGGAFWACALPADCAPGTAPPRDGQPYGDTLAQVCHQDCDCSVGVCNDDGFCQ